MRQLHVRCKYRRQQALRIKTITSQQTDFLQTVGGHFLGLIANQSPGTEARLRKYGITRFFGLVLASAELGLSKPDPAIFALALERVGCGVDHAWMVGDRLDNDIRPAKLAGWRTIRILNGYNARQRPRDELDIPDYTISTLSEIPDILDPVRKGVGGVSC